MKLSDARKIGALTERISNIEDALAAIQASKAVRPVVQWQIEGVMFKGELALALIKAVESVLLASLDKLKKELAALGVEDDGL